MPIIEEVTTRLDKAKLFTVVNAKDGFWQTTSPELQNYFHHSLWTIPLASNAPEVWQRTVHEFVEGLQGVEVIADDFIIAGFGDTTEEAYKSHLIL